MDNTNVYQNQSPLHTNPDNGSNHSSPRNDFRIRYRRPVYGAHDDPYRISPTGRGRPPWYLPQQSPVNGRQIRSSYHGNEAASSWRHDNDDNAMMYHGAHRNAGYTDIEVRYHSQVTGHLEQRVTSPYSNDSGCYGDTGEHHFRPIRSRGPSPYFSTSSNSPPYGAGSPGSPGWTEPPSISAPHVEVVITNLDYNISAREWKKILLTTFQQQVQVLNVYIQTQPDGSNMGVVCVPSIDDARLAIAQFHRKKIGYKRIHVSLMKLENSAASASLRSEAIALLRDANGLTLPLFKFIELFEKRFHKSVSVSELYKMKDVLAINDSEGSGRTVTLLQSSTTSPTNSNPGSPDSGEGEDLFESPVCLLHCPEGSEFYMTALDCAGLPNVQMRLRGFAPQVHTLLHTHQGSLPLMSFPACYASEFGPTATQDGGVPLEHLITCIPGIQVTISKGGMKKVHWSENKATTNYDLGRFTQSPVLNQQLLQLSKEVVDLLKNSPQCRMPFSKFIPSYHHHFGRQCRVADYGYTKLAELFEAIPHVLQVMGTGNRGILTLTHRAQVKRFTTDLLRLLRAQLNKAMRAIEIPGQYQKVLNRPFDMTEYGVSYIEDMLSEVPDSIAVVTGENENMMIAIPRRDQTPEEFERTKIFCNQVIDLLRHSPQCTMPFNKFIPSYHHHFGKQCRVADYGFTKLLDLFEAVPHIVKLVDDGEEKLITLTDPERMKVLADQIMALLNSLPDKALAATDLLTNFMKFHGHSLQLQDFGVHNIIALMKRIKHVVRIDDNCGVTMIRLVDRSHIQHMAYHVLTMLMASPSGSTRLDEMREKYMSQSGHSLDVSVINDEMNPYVKLYGSGDDYRVKLVVLMQFSRDILTLLNQHGGRIPLHFFEETYEECFGVRLRPGAYGYPSVTALIQAIPQVVSVKGRGIKRTLYACNDFLERISHQIAYNPIVTDVTTGYPNAASNVSVSDEDLRDLRPCNEAECLGPDQSSNLPSNPFSPTTQKMAEPLIGTVPQPAMEMEPEPGAAQKTLPANTTSSGELLQMAARLLPGKVDQAVTRPTYAHATIANMNQTAQRTQYGNHFNFDFTDPGKALLAIISQKPEEKNVFNTFSPFSPIDETHHHIKSVLALLSPITPDVHNEPERPLVLENPRPAAVLRKEEKPKSLGSMDLSSLLAHLPPPRPPTALSASFSSSDSDGSPSKADSPRRKPSKLVANFGLNPEMERLN